MNEEIDLEFKIKINDDEAPATKKNQNSYSTLSTNQNTQAQGQYQESRSNDALSMSSSNYDLNKASHPQACIFTFIFKLSALLCYLFLNIILSNRITVFIVVVLFTTFDFWTVKNVTGRLLVGLRWQNNYTDDGTEVWSYQSHDSAKEPNTVDSAFFWSSQLGAIVTWAIFTFINILSFNVYWTCLDAIVLTLSSTNFYGFYKCRGEHQKKLSGIKEEFTKKGMNFIGNMMMKQQFGQSA